MKFDPLHYKSIEGWFNSPDVYFAMVNMYNNGIFVEVGSWKGQSSVFMAGLIANYNKNIKFYCVDTWEGSEEHKSEDSIVNKTLFDIFKKNTEEYSEYINPIKKKSIEASQMFCDMCLDFVYIDAAHDYENVKNDILAWYPKVKIGGTIAGDDYHPSWPGVTQAVNEWAFKDNKNVMTNGVSWVYQKR